MTHKRKLCHVAMAQKVTLQSIN